MAKTVKDDIEFAVQVRRLLISIATMIYKKYDNQVLLIILTGHPRV